MSEELLSVGLDVGTTTTQLILSRLKVENRASGFAVPELAITDRQVIYRSPVHFTPLIREELVDAEKLRELVEQAYREAGVSREQVDSGAIIITGETSRKENAAAVLKALSGFAGDFVAATAGPDLESVLAAKGAGAVEYSEKTGKTVLHMDIGGGTSNLALIEKGQVVQTGCLNVGGRLIKRSAGGQITYVSPVLTGLTDLKPGDYPEATQLEGLARILTAALEMAAGCREKTELLDKLLTRETVDPWKIPEPGAVISFSGGVAECIRSPDRPGVFGDMGTELGDAIRESRLCQGEYSLGQETIRATVIGAGSHSTRLSGSTVFVENIRLPLKNVPVAVISAREQEAEELPKIIAGRLQQKDSAAVVLALPGFFRGAGYDRMGKLARAICEGFAGRPILVCLEADMAKALGQQLSLQLPEGTPCLCIDGIRLQEESFLDIGAPLGPALPVVVKTLVLESTGGGRQ